MALSLGTVKDLDHGQKSEGARRNSGPGPWSTASNSCFGDWAVQHSLTCGNGTIMTLCFPQLPTGHSGDAAYVPT